MPVDGSLWPVSGVLGSCGCGGEDVSRSGLLFVVSDEGGGCCLG